MQRQLARIGLHDTSSTRKLLGNHLIDVFNDPSSIARVQDNGRVVRESLLMGPNGGIKLETIWRGDQLITVNAFGGGIK